tara:strand:+ start:953 stop:1168 length:216 start_codon:yes stop_codon:yes gene_type:complete
MNKNKLNKLIKKEVKNQLSICGVDSSNKVNYELGWELAMAHIHTSEIKDKDSFSAKHREALDMFIKMTDFN